MFLSHLHQPTTQYFRYPAYISLNVCGLGLIVEYWEYGEVKEIWWCYVLRLQDGIPTKSNFRWAIFSSSMTRISWSAMAFSYGTKTAHDGPLPFDILRFRLCMTEWSFAFFQFLLLHYRRFLDSEQMGGRTSSHLQPKDSGVLLHLNGTIVFNDCMDWANSAMDGYQAGMVGSKDSFFFTVNRSMYQWL